MNFLDAFDRVYSDLRRDKWLHYFTIFCRIALALGFLPAGIVKVRGERFTGLPSNHPLGHYFDALHLTGLYYTFLGVGQLLAAVLLIVPRTALLGAMLYFPIIVNICVLTYATRFEGTRIATLMLLANLFLLIWDYDRLRHVLPFRRTAAEHIVIDKNSKFPTLVFLFFFAAAASVIFINQFLYDIRPGNSEEECTGGNPTPARLQFCDCIYKYGNPLQVCLKQYQSAIRAGTRPE
jgi:uncharacterized membrane protein YphA (DoxX/SURF4 family)